MESSLRYNMTHIGDIFVETIQKTADAAVQCSKGVFFTYDIQMLRCKKNKAAKEVGERVSVLVKEGAFDLYIDPVLSELVAKLDSIEKELEAYECARRWRTVINPKNVDAFKDLRRFSG